MKKIGIIFLLFTSVCFFGTLTHASEVSSYSNDSVLRKNNIVKVQNYFKVIIEEVEDDGSFKAQPLGAWLKRQKFCTVDDISNEYDIMKRYSIDLEMAGVDNENTSSKACIPYEEIVQEEDVIDLSNDYMEIVTEVDLSHGIFETLVIDLIQ
ncbi:MAG: hypothetical protein PHE06_07995 [Lachnospiraceae bacterium]|nr:hypothetical protein [Lachnospiraceae bacterium]